MKTSLLLLSLSLSLLAGEWRQPTYLGQGDLWRKRVAITIAGSQKDGAGASIEVGKAPGKIDLAGEEIASLRLLTEAGVELLYTVLSPDGDILRKGLVPDGGKLVVPVIGDKETPTKLYLYFDNPSAWAVPDFLPYTAPEGWNGGFEEGKSQPAGWRQKFADKTHRNYWTTERPHSGKKCVKTVVDKGAEGSWVAFYHSRLPVVGGANCKISAWVRAQNVEGKVGWYAHVGSPLKPMMTAPSLESGPGTYDWRRVELEFTAPKDATIISIGTMLNGTGTAWFDDLQVECDRKIETSITVGKTEYFSQKIEPMPKHWEMTARGWNRRLPIRTTGRAKSLSDDTFFLADLSQSLRNAPSARHLCLMQGKTIVPFALINGKLLFQAPRPSPSLWLYISDRKENMNDFGKATLGSEIPSDQILIRKTEKTDPKAYAALLDAKANLAKNPSFETDRENLQDWPGATESGDEKLIRYALGQNAAFGKYCSRVTVPPEAPKAWVGRRQSIPVKGGTSYLYAAWIRAENLDAGATIGLHAHQLKADGTKCEKNAHISTVKSGAETDRWQLFSNVTQTPEDAAFLQIHLTMPYHGTIEHDGILVAKIANTPVGRVESREGRPGISFWQEEPIIKVFQEDVPPQEPSAIRIGMARNEQEPLQVALRSERSFAEVKIEVVTPMQSTGAKLAPAEIGVVGYVPVDSRGGYFHQALTPSWERKLPHYGGTGDGWAGWWPDPILPQTTCALQANQTQPIWLTFETGKTTPPGDYQGKIRLLAAGKLLKEIPFTVTVWDFVLPETHSLAAIYDIRGQWNSMWKRPDDNSQKIRERMMRFLARKKLSADRVGTNPTFTRDKNGEIRADFGNYDKAMTLFFDELKFPKAYTPRTFYLFGWANLPKKILGEAPYEGEYPYEGVDRSKLRPEYKRTFQSMLRLYWEHMKEKGWEKKLVLYISDEPHFRHKEIQVQMQALCDMIHEVDAAIPIYSSTWRHCPEWNGYLDVWGVGSYGCFPVEEMQARKAAGERLWFTTDGQMCLDTPYCGIERILPYYCFKYDVEAYEFWGVDWLTYNPFEFGWHSFKFQSNGPGSQYQVRYPNGDGYLVYPGKMIGYDGIVTSVRLEAARDGIEDYESLQILKQLVAKTGDQPGAKLLDEVRALIEIPNAGGRTSSFILPQPKKLAALRLRVAQAILRLQK